MWKRLFAFALVFWTCHTARADALRVLVVVDAPHSARVGNAIRHGLSVQVGALVSVTEGESAPDVVLTVTARDARTVTVRYWDIQGHADALSLPLPNATARLEDVASTMGAILLRRNSRLPDAASSEKSSDGETDRACAPQTGAVPAARPRMFALNLGDFR